MFDQHQIEYHNALKAAKMAYYSTIISSDISHPRALFRTVNNIIKPLSNINCSTTKQCNEFLKIDNIYNSIACDHVSESVELHPPNLSDRSIKFQGWWFWFHKFLWISNSLIRNSISKFVLSMNSTTCILDPFPTTVLKNCLSVILPHITANANTSLSEGIVSHALKMSAVTLVLKKPGSDIAVMSNYRPISNLPFLAKVLERVVVSQLQTLYTNSLLEPFQSGFRSGHSTETALVRVLNYLLIIADSGACGLLVLLDLSAAFDMICHSILMNTIHRWISPSVTVLSWFKSYLSQRSQFVYLVLTDLRLCLCVRVFLRGQFWVRFYSVFACYLLGRLFRSTAWVIIVTRTTPRFILARSLIPLLPLWLFLPVCWKSRHGWNTTF